MEKGNNKGFSLIEIIIGIGMLAVIVIPILHTFITSAQINRDSRQVMIQTEVAQTIMEGFAGKTYFGSNGVKATVAGLVGIPTGDVASGNEALSTIDDNWFNTGGTYYNPVTPIDMSATNELASVAKDEVVWNGATITTSTMLSDNSVMASMNQVFADKIDLAFTAHTILSGTEARMISSWMDSTGRALFIGYGNIHYEGYRFDAVVSFLPMAKSPTDLYYTYRILLTLYEYKPGMLADERFQHVLMTMDGGIMAGKE